MSSKWHQKKAKEAEYQEELKLKRMGNLDEAHLKVWDPTETGEDELFEKKLSKEEKKALAKKKREEKKRAKEAAKKGGGSGDGGDDGDGGGQDEKNKIDAAKLLQSAREAAEHGDNVDLSINNAAAEALAEQGTICTFATSKKGVDARSRDINVTNFTLQHKGMVMLDGTEIILNHGQRYGLIGRNGCGKSTLMNALGARAVPIPDGIDVFHLKEEIEPSDTITAIEAVMSVDVERENLEKEVENLNDALALLAEQDDSGGGGGGGNNDDDDDEGLTMEEQQEKLMDALNYLYERLDLLDADTAETRARSILRGLGFTHEMQGKLTKDFSGGWRMRVSLARALFIQPTLLLLDEPTNHLDMEAVIWLEDYLSRWDKILLLISHSQDFMNNVCSNMIHFTSKRKLVYYDGNYDQFIKTKTEKEENQMKQYAWEQDQIKSMKEYIARFGHGTSKNAKQAQSKQKVLDKMVRGGLTAKPEVEKQLNFRFPDPGDLPPPVLAFHDVSFAYPGCQPLYTNVDVGIDLDSRIALVGPNGAGKTTLVKLMAGELEPTLGDIRPHGHLKLGRFTQHFVDVLDLDITPLQYFDKLYPGTPYDEQRKYLGRFGVSGKMQVQKMDELSDGQKSRVVFAKLGREVPHILLLDEPTNHLDMESIDALADAINDFNGGIVLVSHDMRLISQVAETIWICDHKKVEPYRGDIQSFKMDMRSQMDLHGEQKGTLRGDASEKVTKETQEEKKAREAKKAAKAAAKKKKESSISVAPSITKSSPGEQKEAPSSFEMETLKVATPAATAPSSAPSSGRGYIPPHLRNKDNAADAGPANNESQYVPPHLRNK
mmetsp:Transcript_4166/g.8891  ORF Transcript_4166/g.8891 Transcript_4166/m.8891 type:complete len:832 (+) Transcript_4166:147-2642(+)|eukprot:CAMPEP_0178474690 /NCGR_PEP_ID=MMETSP0696-20121128/2730_1 /TAXON_ID=265572 /ORGANISM="Extubocellulus spinifer, Strain CCMP396" /LENGTH=831 /DNA_ID=CAMNT_0020101947 /DNA_START=87 /DNA_END=2582 /DNA_ORIENTATION=-